MIVLFRKQMDNVRLQLIIHLNVQPSRTARIQGLKSKGKREIWEIGKLLCGSLKGNFLASGQKNPMLLNQWKSVKDQEGQRDGGSTLCSMNFPTNFLPLSSVCLLWYYSFIIYLGRSQTLLEINSGKKVEQSKGGITSAWLEGVASKLFFLLRFPNSINLTSFWKSEATFQTVLPDR